MTALWCLLLVSLRLIAAKVPSDKDAAALARAINAAAAPFSEIVFYATDPVLGLNIYLDKEIESVPANGLADEFAESESPLWLLRPEAASGFLAATAAHGREFTSVGRVGERYLLFQESSNSF